MAVTPGDTVRFKDGGMTAKVVSVTTLDGEQWLWLYDSDSTQKSWPYFTGRGSAWVKVEDKFELGKKYKKEAEQYLDKGTVYEVVKIDDRTVFLLFWWNISSSYEVKLCYPEDIKFFIEVEKD